MGLLLSAGPQGKRAKCEVVCADCEEQWVMFYFPVSVDTLEQLTCSLCISCGGKNLEYFADCLKDPNDD